MFKQTALNPSCSVMHGAPVSFNLSTTRAISQQQMHSSPVGIALQLPQWHLYTYNTEQLVHKEGS